MPPMVYVPTSMVCAFLLMAGVARLSWMKALVAGAGILVLLALPLYILQVSHLVVGQGLEPRYILPLLPVVSLVLLTGFRPDQAVRLSRPIAWFTWALVSGANGIALIVNIRLPITIAVAADGDQKAIGPAAVEADEPSLTPAQQVVDAEPTPVEAVAPDAVRPGIAPS